ncbi:Carboxypeptidase regulatory-like domain protein [uncultured archaeon]|nr:Carboxypeptidase regulatory-like domain protein [uncultured archaeon]
MSFAPRYGFALLALLLLAAPLLALQFNVTVTNEIGTRLPGTKVQILTGDTVLYENSTIWCPKADVDKGCPVRISDRAQAGFELAPDTYFLRLQRSGYPDHVYLQTLDQDTALTVIMFIRKSTYTMYGRVSNASHQLDGMQIKLMDADTDTVVRTSAIKANGDYLIDSLWPGRKYYLRVDDGEQRLLSEPFSYNDVGAYYLELAGAQAPLRNVSLQPLLSGPDRADLHSRISVTLMSGERPMEGQTVTVRTPNGELNLTTDADGIARVQAAEGGQYTFKWSSLRLNVTVPMPPAPAAPAAPQAPAPAFEVTVPEQAPAAPAGPMVEPTVALGAAGLVLMAGGLTVLALLAVFGPKLWKKMNEGAKKTEAKARSSGAESGISSSRPSEAAKSSPAPKIGGTGPARPEQHRAHPARHGAHKKK